MDPLQYMKGRQRRRIAAVGPLPAPDATLAAPKPQAAPATAVVKQDVASAASGAAEQKPTMAAASAAPPPVPKQEAGGAAATGAAASQPSPASVDERASKRQRLGANRLLIILTTGLGSGKTICCPSMQTR